MSSATVLLIHGVNSSGEWHETTTKECHGVFDCESVKYRYYHGLAGAVKVYAWPTGLFSMLGLGSLLFDSATVRSTLIIAVLVLCGGVAALAEWDWEKRLVRALMPVLLTVFGVAALLLPGGHERLDIAIGAVVAISLYLDMREYGHPYVSVHIAGIVAIVLLAAATWGVDWLLSRQSTVPLQAALGILALIAVVEPCIRQARAFGFVRKWLKKARDKDPFPHVVAHSLGTYVVGHLINEQERLFLGRVLFTGCGLDRRFPWHRSVGPETSQKCWAVKNYVGGVDIVPVLTGVLRWAWVCFTSPARIPGIIRGTHFLGDYVHWRPLGWAGQRGFRDREPIVHTQASDIACSACAKGAVSAVVHNVRARFAGHSTLNQDAGYQCFQWLPFLWADTPDKFDYWKGICTLGQQAAVALESLQSGVVSPAQIENQNALAQAEQLLLEGPWYWPLNANSLNPGVLKVGRSLRGYVEDIVANFPTKLSVDVDTILKRIPTIVFRKFTAALNEKAQTNPRPEITSLLEPRKTLVAAVCDAINMA
jgi:prepilin signal peptidase PulO-like enzyme (type II secretory pathway)